MEGVQNFISIYYIEFILGLLVGIIILLTLCLINFIKNKKLMERYNLLVNGIEGINVEELLVHINENLGNIHRDIDIIQQEISGIKTKHTFAIQKVGFIRYNAFGDIGSELSYSLALLDDYKNGFVLTSIYGRDDSIGYGKPVRGGSSKIPLSAEEIIAIDRAIKGEGLEKSFY